MNYEQLYVHSKEISLHGRYVTLSTIESLLKDLNTNNQLEIVGESVLHKPIYRYQIGNGKIKIFLWSQMHGNESTTTKALFDFFNLLKHDSAFARKLLETFTFCCLPMLNPDGAELYTRVNANEVDLNRDSQDLSQPESKVLRAVFEEFKPDFCYNLHDQRTIFGVGSTGKPATLSFLAPAFNDSREINDSRLRAINLIAEMNAVLQNYIPGQVGRFDDSFNINCIGDTFQYLGVPTVLFEAGHFPDDYAREITRKYVFVALVSSFKILLENDIVVNKLNEYLNISQNNICFCDFLFKNVKINYDGIEIITNFAVQYKEELIGGKIQFNAYVSNIGELDGIFGHFEYDAEGALYKDGKNNKPELEDKADFYIGSVIFTNGMKKY